MDNLQNPQPATLPQNQNISVFDLAEFPVNKRSINGFRVNFTPKTLHKVLFDYGHNKGTLTDFCDKNHIRYATVLDLRDEYSEIRLLYEQMHAKKVEFLLDDSENAMDNTKTVIETEKGIQQNSAAVRLTELRVKHRQWLAEHRLPEYAPKQVINVNSRSLSVNVTATLADLVEAKITDLQNGFKSV